MPMGGDNLIPLAAGSVLYLGSAVPLETSVGLEALQMPLRDRYLTADPYQKVSGIDAVLTVFSGGILMQYPGDDSSSTWFPMQTLHMCAAVKAVSSSSGSSAFVSIDSPQAQASREPPIFAVITRRSRGVKVLECHVFVCKSSDAALAFVQSCTHAFQHREGWMSGIPGPGTFGSSSRIVAAESACGMADLPRTPLQGFMYSQDQRPQLYNISGMEPPRPAPAPVQPPAPAPAPAPVVQVVQQPPTGVQPVQCVAMNPPGAPVPQVPQVMIPQVPQVMVPQVPQTMVPQGYFADWNQNYGMTYMVVPDSPLYPGDDAYNRDRKKNTKKKKNKKKKKKSKSKKRHEEEEEEEEEDDDEEEEEGEELYYVRRSRLNQGQLPPDFVQVPQRGMPPVNDRYSVQSDRSEVRYVTEPVRPAQHQQQQQSTEIHYIPLPKTSQPFPPDLPPDMNHLIERTTADVFLAKVPPKTGYVYDDQGPSPPSQYGGSGPGYDPYSYRVQLQDLDYDYRRDYDAARQQGPARQGVYDMRLPRTSLEYQYDERGFDGMADRLGYFP